MSNAGGADGGGADLLALINAARGRRHLVTAEHQDRLEEIYAFLEKARKTTAPTGAVLVGAFGAPRPAPVASVFTLARQDQVEWFVPYTARRTPSGGHYGWVWQVESSSEKEVAEKVAVLHRHVESLYRLGIPTFFRQQPRFGLTKLLTSLEAHVRDECVPQETDQLARSAFWSSLQKGVVWFVVGAIAKAVLKHFGPTHAANQVAVFDATGFSPASCRWKLSMRINFVEQAVNPETARQLRLSVIQVLNEEWRDFPRDSGWAAALEPIHHTENLKENGGEQEASNYPVGTDPKFWEHMLDERIFCKGHQHRLVWCDAMQGDLPEGRPLLPFELLSVEAEASSGNVKIEQVRPEAPVAWSVLGSAAPQEPSGHVVAPAVAPIGQKGQQSHAVAAPTGPPSDDWVLFLTEAGRPYYHSNSRNETVWELPTPTRADFRGPFFAVDGQPYYQDCDTSQTVWSLPPAATLLPP